MNNPRRENGHACGATTLQAFGHPCCTTGGRTTLEYMLSAANTTTHTNPHGQNGSRMRFGIPCRTLPKQHFPTVRRRHRSGPNTPGSRGQPAAAPSHRGSAHHDGRQSRRRPH